MERSPRQWGMEEEPHQLDASEIFDLWIGLLAAPVIWSVHFLVVYGLVEFACDYGWFSNNAGGLTVLTWIIVGATALALGLILYAGWSAYHRWNRLTRGGKEAGDAPGIGSEGPRRFLALGGLLLSVLFFMMVLLILFPALLLRACPWST